jgi:alkylation response protein AidB-like acyl-CoA dehydrogenase
LDVSLTSEQQMLVDAVRALARDHGLARPPDRPAGGPAADHVRGGSAGRGEGTAADGRVWEQLAGMGLLELRLPAPAASDGAAMVPASGPGTGVEAALVTEALAHHLVAAPYVGVLVASDLLVRAEAPDELVRDVTSGRRRVVPVLDSSLRRLAGPDEAGVAWDSAGADSGLVLDGAGELVLVPLGPLLPDVADLTRKARTLCRSGSYSAISAQSSGGRDGAGTGAPATAVGQLDLDGRQRVEALLLTLVTADMLGSAAGALDRALVHVSERVQFDRPVGSFQAVQHLCADATVAVEASRSALWHAAWAVDELPASEALAAARTAKAFAAPELVGVCETAIQLHGGIGMTWESLVHVHLRRALLDRQVLGDETHHLDVLAQTRLDAAPADPRDLAAPAGPGTAETSDRIGAPPGGLGVVAEPGGAEVVG